MQYINNFRGIAILMVILAHAKSTIPSDGHTIISWIDLLLSNCTILFVAIAGYFFSSMAENFQYNGYLKNKLLVVLLPYTLISMPAVLIYILHLKTSHPWIDMDWFYSDLSLPVQYGFLMIFGAQLGPMWFVPMIALFYITSPVFIWLKSSPWLIMAFILSLMAAFYTGRPDHDNNPLWSFVYFTPCYLFGMILFKYRNSMHKPSPHSTVLLALYVMSVILFDKLFGHNSSSDLLFKISFTYILLLLCKHYLNRKIPWLNIFARLSFYLFFIHGYFISIFRLEHSSILLNIDKLTAVIIVFIATIFFSIFTYVIGKFVLKRRSIYFLGA